MKTLLTCAAVVFGLLPAVALEAAPLCMTIVSHPQTGLVQQAASRDRNGYRGSRSERPGYRRYGDGYWYPLAAFGVAPGWTGSIGVGRAHREPYCNDNFAPTSQGRPHRCPRY